LISTRLTRANAALLAVGGFALLFAPDVLLPRLISGYPAAAIWFGQLVAAAWLALATLNWFNRDALLGGIYARPLVTTNAMLHMVGSIGMAKAIVGQAAPPILWVAAAPAGLLAIAYLWLLFRGPWERDLAAYRASH